MRQKSQFFPLSRHSLAAAIFHGKKGELYQRYHQGMEDQLGALGLVLNCLVLWNTLYIDTALDQLRAQGRPVADEDVARLSPFVRHHLNVHGKYSSCFPSSPADGGRCGTPMPILTGTNEATTIPQTDREARAVTRCNCHRSLA